MSDTVQQVQGIVHLISDKRTFGIVECDDGVHRFFMPTDIRSPHVFRDLIAGQTRVQGEPYMFKGRPRIKGLVVVVPDSNAVTHGASS
jgi:hypothetical protein